MPKIKLKTNALKRIKTIFTIEVSEVNKDLIFIQIFHNMF